MPRIAADKLHKPWRNDRRWRSHSLACWEDSEWSEWKELAELAGKSVNGWIRDACNEVARYERLNLNESAENGSEAGTA